jgi:peptide/nickel transport system substrate-binding protein
VPRVPRLAALLLVASACGPGPAARPPEHLVVALRADVSGFYPNPPTSNESFTFEINRWIFESLVAFDPALNLVPWLAERWLNPDDRTYVFELRPGLRFSDGSPLTAADVAASLEAAVRRRWATVEYLSGIDSVQALDERRVAVRSRRPDVALLMRLPWGFVLPASALAQASVPVVGSGPYRLERWQPGHSIVLTRNSHYWGPAPGFERVEFRIVPDDAERMALVERGEADIADNVPLEAFERLSRRSDLSLVLGSGHRVLFLALRVDRPPFSDPRVREAVDLALDREALVRRVLLGRAQPASQLLPAGIVGYVPELTVARPDRERARSLLAAAGYAPSLALNVDGPNNRYVRDEAILREVCAQLGQAGFLAEARAMDKGDFYRLIEGGGSLVHLLGWASETGDGGDALEILFQPPGGSGGRLNTTGLADAELDRLVEDVHASADLGERAARLRRAFAHLASLRAVVPLVVQTEAVVHSKRLSWDAPVSRALRPLDFRRQPD